MIRFVKRYKKEIKINGWKIINRASILDAWKNANGFMPDERKAGAKVLTPLVYSDFGEVYKRSIDEMMKIYSLPMFGESNDEPEGHEF